MTQPNRYDLDELRTAHFQLIHQALPQRAKGVPYGKISGTGGLIVASLFIVVPILGFFFKRFFLSFGLDRFVIYWSLLVVGMFLLFLILPKQFYDERKRTRRYAGRMYPESYRTLERLKERKKKDFLASGMPALHIEDRKYFLGVYIYQRKWDVRPNAVFTGYAVVDDAGLVVTDAEIFKKAFNTYDAGLVGAVTTQNLDEQQRRALVENLKYYLPRAERFLRSQRRPFEDMGALADWQDLLARLPSLYVAGKDALTIYKGRENFRRAIGYSFGVDYFHEDALFEKKMNLTYSQYMAAAHGEQIDLVRLISARLRGVIERNQGWVRKQVAIKALAQIWSFAFSVATLIERMAVEGMTSDQHLKLYQEKLALAGARGLLAGGDPSRRNE